MEKQAARACDWAGGTTGSCSPIQCRLRSVSALQTRGREAGSGKSGREEKREASKRGGKVKRGREEDRKSRRAEEETCGCV